MTSELSQFADRLRSRFFPEGPADDVFDQSARNLFALQFMRNSSYRKFCEACGTTPDTVVDWKSVPAIPASAFKEFELSCLPQEQRARVFYSSGTTEHRPGRHFHNAESLAVYEWSLLSWFRAHVERGGRTTFLTPTAAESPHSSLVHMFDVIRRDEGGDESMFVGRMTNDGTWTLDFEAAIRRLETASGSRTRLNLLGTAFSFVHLLDQLAENKIRFQLPPGSVVLETGGYKGRSRVLSRPELHALITERLGIPAADIVCEYGMSELSSQAYDVRVRNAECGIRNGERRFRFPPWARAQIISPETGREVAEGETGLLRIFDLANVFSVMAIQTEDLAIRRAGGFELVGRAARAEPRGCSLMSDSALRTPHSARE
jgi:hypothetical protein